MRSLTEYRAWLEEIDGGTVPVAKVLEIVATAEAEIAAARQEYTVSRAAEVSGKSRSWIVRRLKVWQATGLARQMDDGTWLVKDAALPARVKLARGGFDPALGPKEIARRLLRAS